MISVSFFKNLGFIIIPIATSISSWINALLLYVFLHNENYFKFSKKLFFQITRILVSAILMSVFLYNLLYYFDSQLSFENNYKVIYLLFIIVLSILIYFFASLFTKAFKINDIKIKY